VVDGVGARESARGGLAGWVVGEGWGRERIRGAEEWGVGIKGMRGVAKSFAERGGGRPAFARGEGGEGGCAYKRARQCA